MADKLSVIYVEPGKCPELIEIENTYNAKRMLVGGDIEVEDLSLEDHVAMVCNESGKAEGLPLNRAIWGEGHKLVDVVAGAFFIAYLPSDSFESIPDDLASKYLEKFKHPEMFFDAGDGIEVKPYTPAS